MQLNVEHNLTDDQLRKALSGMAVASGIEPEVIETLTKACACDDTPKEPRTRAMRLLFHMMQQEYWQAARDIERYARMINKGELEKATSHSPLTADQLRQLQQAINDRFAFVTGQIQSVDYQPAPDLLERWKQFGLVDPSITPETFMASVPAEMYFVRNAFLMGKFIEAVEAGKSYQEVMQLALHAPILAPDLHAIAVAEQQTANFITNNAADLATEAGKLWAKKQAETVRSMAIDFHARKLTRTVLDREEKQAQGIATPDRQVETWRQFSSELHHTMTDRSRDWDRVAFYELTDAQKQGMAHKLLQDGNVDKLVYKRPMPDACAQCKHLYLKPDGKTPRVFKLSRLINNGTNIGRKPHPVRGGKVAPGGRADGNETLKAVAGLMHPWCACAGPYEVTGHEAWIKQVKKSNPYHDEKGKFTTGNGTENGAPNLVHPTAETKIGRGLEVARLLQQLDVGNLYDSHAVTIEEARAISSDYYQHELAEHPISSPAFKGAMVTFADSGYNHTHGDHYDRIADENIKRRLKLLPKAKAVLATTPFIDEVRTKEDGTTEYGILGRFTDGDVVRVVVEEKHEGNKTFLTVYTWDDVGKKLKRESRPNPPANEVVAGVETAPPTSSQVNITKSMILCKSKNDIAYNYLKPTY